MNIDSEYIDKSVILTKTKRALIHVVCMCNDCNWRNESMIIGETEARKHARKTGHNVVVELGHYYELNKK
jgi:hypothetical protein